MHSFFSSAITKTDWYIESLEELIVDILHSGLSLWRENTSRHFLSQSAMIPTPTNALRAHKSARSTLRDALTCTFW